MPRPSRISTASFRRVEALRRFQSVLPVVTELVDAHGARDRLVSEFIRALERADTATLAKLKVSKSEYAFLYFPSSVYSRKPYELPPDVAWLLSEQDSRKGATRLLRRLSGRKLRFDGYSCGTSAREQENVFWRACQVSYIDPASSVRVTRRLFGGDHAARRRTSFSRTRTTSESGTGWGNRAVDHCSVFWFPVVLIARPPDDQGFPEQSKLFRRECLPSSFSSLPRRLAEPAKDPKTVEDQLSSRGLGGYRTRAVFNIGPCRRAVSPAKPGKVDFGTGSDASRDNRGTRRDGAEGKDFVGFKPPTLGTRFSTWRTSPRKTFSTILARALGAQ